MGVVHKLKPRIIEYILEAREKDPSLSCRKFVPLIKRKFGIKVSKSSINTVLKSSGASAPPGKQLEIFIDYAGAFFLKGADLKLGVSYEITEAVRAQIKDIPAKTIQAYNEVLVYLGLFGMKGPEELNQYRGSGLWALSGLKFDRLLPSKINNYYKLLGDRRLYYNISLRLVSLFSIQGDFDPAYPQEQNIKAEFANALINLHKYAQKEFFPPIYRNFDLPKMRQQFYSLSGFQRRSPSGFIVRFSEYKNLDLELDIASACRKFNAAEIANNSGQKLYIQPHI